MYNWTVAGISGHCQVFNKPEAMGKVIDAATMLGRTTGHLPILVAQYVILARLYVSIDRKHKNRSLI
jgi:hypothetical protein